MFLHFLLPYLNDVEQFSQDIFLKRLDFMVTYIEEKYWNYLKSITLQYTDDTVLYSETVENV